ncbi:uncharacterized protein BDZ99DRAFT_200097 [Mytilinidion resinicola]|uniref:Uncharacterized protein n=1 Tax=Mytilinidion resinicola TaxID=574789 RepID=A0A6A6Y1W9_9PEZI|nr:uncharacterized protein BDZ99DRAFT_200097 [Mytilinidion resinicola]KAF2802811.1 hypothetical protein BDZ99DRAFT_200097 [Mytilinidion resinicola]
MKITSVLVALAAFAPFAIAGDYEGTTVSTFYSTKTVYLVHTETKTGTPPAYTSSSTSSSSSSSSTPTPVYYPTSYGTSVPSFSSVSNYTVSSTGAYYPTGSGTGSLPNPTTTGAIPTFTGAASHLSSNALVAAIAAGVGYLAL